MKKRYPTPVELPSGNWRCQIMVDGKRRSVTADSPQEAISQAVLLRDGAKIKSAQNLTLGAVVDEYIDLRAPVLSPSTVVAYRSYRDHIFQPYMDRDIRRLDRRQLQRMVSDEARSLSAKTIKNAWGLISSALKEYQIDTSGINLPPIPRKERPWLTADEILTFCDMVKGKPFEIPALLALCSLRRSEVYALDWKDVDVKAGTVTVRRSVVKGEYGYVTKETNKTKSSSRVVPIIIPQLISALKENRMDAGPVCTGNPNTLYKQINKVCRDADLPEVGVHGLRHSFASLCHHVGIPEMECARIGGWSDLNTMRKIYTHLSEHQITDAADQLRRFFD